MNRWKIEGEWKGEEGDRERNIEKGTVELDRRENRFK